MNPLDQRIAIAESVGLYTDLRNGIPTCWPDVEKPGIECPDYLNDLNAMHEVEKQLTVEQGKDYIRKLYHIYENIYEAFEYAAGEPIVTTWYLFTATAAQRAEAYLRTIGKWKD